MKVNELFPSKYLRASDLDGDTVVTIKSLMVEEIGGERKPVMYFPEIAQGLVLNKTNTGIIASLYDNETDNWPGRKIILYSTEVDFRGEIVDAVRVRRQIPEDGGTEESDQNEQASLPL